MYLIAGTLTVPTLKLLTIYFSTQHHKIFCSLAKQLIKFSCTYWPLPFCKIFKKTWDNPELWRWAIFGSKMTQLSRIIFLTTNHYYYFHLPIGPFHCAKLKKKFLQITYLPKWQFFHKTCKYTLFLSFMPIYMPKIKVIY